MNAVGERFAYHAAAAPLDVALERADVALYRRHRAACNSIGRSCARVPRTSTCVRAGSSRGCLCLVLSLLLRRNRLTLGADQVLIKKHIQYNMIQPRYGVYLICDDFSC